MPDADTPSPEPRFRGFHERRAVRIYHRNLPHWRQEGATYFVTFRQTDSIPHGVLETWDRLRCEWLEAHAIDPAWQKAAPERYRRQYSLIRANERQAFERESAKLLHLELDQCHGSCCLKSPPNAAVVSESLLHIHSDLAWTGDFVIMPNHVHAILQPREGHELQDILESVKKFTSRRIVKPVPEATIERGFWQAESYDRIIRDEAELAVYRRYIEQNPAKAKLCAGEFLHHRCHWL